jgi:hypothetical protein
LSCARLAQGVVCGLFWVVLDLDAAKKWMSATPSALTPHSAPTPRTAATPGGFLAHVLDARGALDA